MALAAQEVWVNQYLTPAELLQRFWLWRLADRGEIIGIMLEGDDPVFYRIPTSIQRGWAQAIRGTRTDIPLLGLLGAAALTQSDEEPSRYWDETTFDHLVLVAYCYDGGEVWGPLLDQLLPTHPEGGLRP